MIDTHCHLVPGVDDGPDTVEDALSLARELVSQGVETVVCTPHWSRSFPTTLDGTRDAFSVLQAALEREGVPLEVFLAAELSDVVAATRPTAEIGERSLRGQFVVVELLSDALMVHAAAIVRRLTAAGLTPVIAHPERARAVQANPGEVAPLRAGGALVQVVASSLTGEWSAASQQAAWAMFESGQVDLVGSDAHGVSTRPSRLREAGLLVAERLGQDAWSAVTEERPAALVGRGDPGTTA